MPACGVLARVDGVMTDVSKREVDVADVQPYMAVTRAQVTGAREVIMWQRCP